MSMIVVVMGVSGSGKTTIGTLLARRLECPYLEGDSLHSAENVAKMSRGIPLTDTDRISWLEAIRERIVGAYTQGQNLVVGCSALKESYRDFLARAVPIVWIYLKGEEELIRSRLAGRTGHFVTTELLASQIHALEEPHDAIVADISPRPEVVVDRIVARLWPKPDLRVLADVEEVGRRAAEAAVPLIEEATRERGRCSLVLSGGTTPRPFHGFLASELGRRIPWSNVHVFWSDERYVPHDDPRSNYRMAVDTLLRHVPCPPANIHPMPTHHVDPTAAAREHEATLRAFFGEDPPVFDLAILGLGADGHTASLYPASDAVRERRRWVLGVNAVAEPPTRLTLTLPLLTRSAHTFFLVTGAEKAEAVRATLDPAADPLQTPAAAIQRSTRDVVWWLDRPAAAKLTPNP